MIYLSDLDWEGPDDWDRPTWKNRKDGRLYCILALCDRVDNQAQYKAMEQILEGGEQLYVKEGGEPSHPVKLRARPDCIRCIQAPADQREFTEGREYRTLMNTSTRTSMSTPWLLEVVDDNGHPKSMSFKDMAIGTAAGYAFFEEILEESTP